MVIFVSFASLISLCLDFIAQLLERKYLECGKVLIKVVSDGYKTFRYLHFSDLNSRFEMIYVEMHFVYEVFGESVINGFSL